MGLPLAASRKKPSGVSRDWSRSGVVRVQSAALYCGHCEEYGHQQNDHFDQHQFENPINGHGVDGKVISKKRSRAQ